MADILITTMGTGGDVYPFLTIGRALKNRGHRVTVVTHSHFRIAVKSSDLHFAALDTVEESELMLLDGPMLNTLQGALSFVNRHIMARIPRECRILQSLYNGTDTVIITRSEPGFAARLTAERLGIPLLAIFMAPAHLLGLPVYEELVKELLASRLNSCRSQLGLPELQDWANWLQYRWGIALWPQWFCAHPTDCQISVQYAGFVLSDDPSEWNTLTHPPLPTLTDRPRILATAGTGYFGGDDFFRVLIPAAAAADCQSIVVTRHDELLPRELPHDCIVLREVESLGSLMRNVALVCHHGGMGTLGQALAAGTPQLVMAAGGDRPHNGKLLAELGIAETIPVHLRTTVEAAAALKRLISAEPVKQQCRALAEKIDHQGALDFICRSIENTIASIRKPRSSVSS